MAREPASGQGIKRISAILQALARGPRSGLRLTDVSAETKLNKATVHRLLAGLCEVGFVEQDYSTSQFHLGFEMFVLGASAVNRYGFREIARPHLLRLENKSQDTTYLSVRSGFDAVCIDRQEGSYPVKVLTLSVGDRRPLGIGGGSLALLAFMSDAEIEQAIEANRERLAAYPTVDTTKLYSLVEAARKQGYAFFDGLVIPEMAGIGVPVRDKNGKVIAAIGMSAITSRMKSDRRAVVLDWMYAEARALEEKLAMMTAGLPEASVDQMKLISLNGDVPAAETPVPSSSAPAKTRKAATRKRRVKG